MKPSELIKKIEALGWEHQRTSGSHATFKHPIIPKLITVPVHSNKELGIGLARKLLKIAGLK